jgi:hypothetical protein
MERNTTCTQCEAQFSSRDSLKRHRKTVHDTVQSNCPYCKEKYSRQDSLCRHILKHHPGLTLKTSSTLEKVTIPKNRRSVTTPAERKTPPVIAVTNSTEMDLYSKFQQFLQGHPPLVANAPSYASSPDNSDEEASGQESVVDSSDEEREQRVVMPPTKNLVSTAGGFMSMNSLNSPTGTLAPKVISLEQYYQKLSERQEITIGDLNTQSSHLRDVNDHLQEVHRKLQSLCDKEQETSSRLVQLLDEAGVRERALLEQLAVEKKNRRLAEDKHRTCAQKASFSTLPTTAVFSPLPSISASSIQIPSSKATVSRSVATELENHAAFQSLSQLFGPSDSPSNTKLPSPVHPKTSKKRTTERQPSPLPKSRK